MLTNSHSKPHHIVERQKLLTLYFRVLHKGDTLLNAEAAFMQGNFSDAQILLEQTYSTIASNGQSVIFSYGICQKLLQFQHFGNLMPGKHTAH